MSDNINEIKETIEEKAEEAKEAVEEKAEEAKEAAEEKAEDVKEAVEEKAKEAKEAAEEKAEEVKEAAEEKTEEAKEAAEEKAEEVKEAVEEKAEEVTVSAPGPAGEKAEEAAAETAPEEKPAEVSPESAAEPEKTKKKGKAGKVILIILIVLLALLLLLAGSAMFAVRAATRDNIPKAPTVSSADMNEFAINAASEVFTENTITVDSSQFNAVLDQVKASVNGSVEGVEVEDLFCELKDGKGTIYGRIYVEEIPVNDRKIKLDKTFPVQLDFDVDFAEPEIAFIPEKLMCGSIEVPMNYVSAALDSAQLPENIRAENGVIYYDTSVLDEKIDEIIRQKVAEKMEENEMLGLLGSILGEDTVTDIITDATDVQIHDADIVDDKLVISAQVI